MIAEYDDGGQLLRRFIYGSFLDEPACMQVDGSSYFYHFNALGSVVALSDDAGNEAEIYTYSPFGLVLQNSTLVNPYLYTGRRYDAEMELYYYRARMYNPALGRFLQPDPIGFAGGINLYGYVLNNPINLIDPFGLAWRQQRPLDSYFLRNTTIGALHHDRFLFDDGTETGYYDDSRVRDDSASQELKDRYENIGEKLDDDILKEAVSNIKPKWDNTEGSKLAEYKLTDWKAPSHNCQDYCDEVLKEYEKIKKNKTKHEKQSGTMK